MKAKLVTVSLCVRVIVTNNATDEQIAEAAKGALHDKLQSDILEDLESIADDIDVPFGTIHNDNKMKGTVLKTYRRMYKEYLASNNLADDSDIISDASLVQFCEDNIEVDED